LPITATSRRGAACCDKTRYVQLVSSNFQLKKMIGIRIILHESLRGLVVPHLPLKRHHCPTLHGSPGSPSKIPQISSISSWSSFYINLILTWRWVPVRAPLTGFANRLRLKALKLPAPAHHLSVPPLPQRLSQRHRQQAQPQRGTFLPESLPELPLELDSDALLLVPCSRA
jgi:hypothetical protein